MFAVVAARPRPRETPHDEHVQAVQVAVAAVRRELASDPVQPGPVTEPRWTPALSRIQGWGRGIRRPEVAAGLPSMEPSAMAAARRSRGGRERGHGPADPGGEASDPGWEVADPAWFRLSSRH